MVALPIAAVRNAYHTIGPSPWRASSSWTVTTAAGYLTRSASWSETWVFGAGRAASAACAKATKSVSRLGKAWICGSTRRG